MSIMMTRSVGDRYGPRSCIALPEISAYTVPVNMHARFVLATDGVWDVVSLNDVRCCGLLKKFQDSRVLATHLASKALRRRERAGMRADDISVLVVDVNPHCFLDCGGERNGGGDSGDSTLMGGFRSGSGCAPGCTIA
jgi:serine/threonine protein phosphatase PrpC